MSAIWANMRNSASGTGFSTYVLDKPKTPFEFETAGAIKGSPVIDSNGNLYFSNEASILYAITSTGSSIWLKNFNGESISGSAALGGGAVWVCKSGVEQGVKGFNTVTGNQVAFQPTSSIGFSSPVVFEDTVYFSCGSSTLSAITFSGSIKWTYVVTDTNPAIKSTVAVSPSTKSIYFLSSNSVLYSLSSSGSLEWKTSSDSADSSTYSSPSVGSDGTIYLCGNSDHYLFAYSSVGSLKWKVDIVKGSFSTPSIDSSGNIYLLNFNGTIFSVDTIGSVKWTFQTDNNNKEVTSISLLIDGSGNIYGGYKTFYCLNSGGSVLWTKDLNFKSVNVGLGILLSSAVIGSNNMIYVGSTDKKLYAMGNLNLKFSKSKSNGLSTSSIIIIAVVVPVGVIIIAYLVYRYLNVFFQKPKGRDESRIDIGEIYMSTEKDLIQSGSKGTNDRSAGNFSSLYDSNFDKDLRIKWSEVSLGNLSANDAVLGYGSFGTVIRGQMRRNEGIVDVAVKVLTRSSAKLNSKLDFKEICYRTCHEVQLMAHAYNKVDDKTCITKVYGLVEGVLPTFLTKMFHLEEGEFGIGIVMKFEAGGSLESYLNNNPNLDTSRKVWILLQVAKCLAELHTLGVVHGDIKPENILLSDKEASSLCLADFGLSSIANTESELGHSSLQQTKNKRGTPIYCAPEMLVNPFDENFDESVAKASRKTDIYAFSLVCWRVLSGKHPFSGMKTEANLCAQVHQGIRPGLGELPFDTPIGVVDCLSACWDKDRAKRLFAIECVAIIQRAVISLTHDLPNVHFLCDQTAAKDPLNYYIYYHLVRHGLTVNDFRRDDLAHLEKNHFVVVYVSCPLSDSFKDLLENISEKVMFSKILYLVSESVVDNSIGKVGSRIIKIPSASTLGWSQEESATVEILDSMIEEVIHLLTAVSI